MYGVSKKWLGFWILSIFLIPAPLYGKTPTPGEPSHVPKEQSARESKDPHDDKRGTQESPLIIKVLPSPNTNGEADKVAQHQEGKATPDWWLVILTGGLVVATAVLSVVTTFLWRATERLVKGADNTAKRQLRAYIAVKEDDEPIQDIAGPDNGHALEIRMVMKNVGQTPAFKLTQWTSAIVDRETVQLPIYEHDPARGIYMPPRIKMGFVTRIDTPWTRQMLEMETGEDVCLHIWGEIHYVDIFDEPRFVKFRFIKRQGDTGSELEFHPEDNDAN